MFRAIKFKVLYMRVFTLCILRDSGATCMIFFKKPRTEKVTWCNRREGAKNLQRLHVS